VPANDRQPDRASGTGFAASTTTGVPKTQGPRREFVRHDVADQPGRVLGQRASDDSGFDCVDAQIWRAQFRAEPTGEGRLARSRSTCEYDEQRLPHAQTIAVIGKSAGIGSAWSRTTNRPQWTVKAPVAPEVRWVICRRQGWLAGLRHWGMKPLHR
jgi:hypothetical protein